MDIEIPAVAQVRNNFITRRQRNGGATQAAADAGTFAGEEVFKNGAERNVVGPVDHDIALEGAVIDAWIEAFEADRGTVLSLVDQ